jgi:hypothetical protein
MATRDTNACADVEESIRPQVATGNVTGQSINLRGSDSVLFAVSIGAISGTSGDATVKIQDSPDNSTWTNAASSVILGAEPTLSANTAYQFGYIGSRQYVRAIFAKGGETSVAVSVVGVREYLHQEPKGFTVESVV